MLLSIASLAEAAGRRWCWWHGFLGSFAQNWQTAGRTVLIFTPAMDLRNHGCYASFAGDDLRGLLDDLVEWMDANGLARTPSWTQPGWQAAMALVCRIPARVEQLIVVDIARRLSRDGAAGEVTAMNELPTRWAAVPAAEAELGLEARVDDWAMRKFLVTNLEQSGDGVWRWIVNLPVLTQALPTGKEPARGRRTISTGRLISFWAANPVFVAPEDHSRSAATFRPREISVLPAAVTNLAPGNAAAFVQAVLGCA